MCFRKVYVGFFLFLIIRIACVMCLQPYSYISNTHVSFFRFLPVYEQWEVMLLLWHICKIVWEASKNKKAEWMTNWLFFVFVILLTPLLFLVPGARQAAPSRLCVSHVSQVSVNICDFIQGWKCFSVEILLETLSVSIICLSGCQNLIVLLHKAVNAVFIEN